ncbi:Transcriptional adapter 2-beta, partial [Fragariocoptes setiger]
HPVLLTRGLKWDIKIWRYKSATSPNETCSLEPHPLKLYIVAPYMAVECAYCEEKINAKRGLYVKCDQCQDVNLCLECFSSGAELGDHRRNHPYEIIDCGSFPIIDASWKAHEELALLEAIELYGIGNWSEISSKVGTKTEQECMQRYMNVYVDNYIGQVTWQSVDKDAYKVYDHTCSTHGPLSPSLSMPGPQRAPNLSREHQLKLGYMPKRDDFEKEFDNEAELLVSKLAVNANDDNDLDQALKVAHINMYTDRLKERYRRKRVVLEYNLVNIFFQMHPGEDSSTDRTSTTDSQIQSGGSTHVTSRVEASLNSRNHDTACSSTSDFVFADHLSSDSNHKIISTNSNDKKKDQLSSGSLLSSYFDDLEKTRAEEDMNQLEDKLRVFCQFIPAKTYRQLVKNIVGEKELKFKIKELMRLRRNGVTRIQGDESATSSAKTSPQPKKTSQTQPKITNVALIPDEVSSDTSIQATPNKANPSNKKGNKISSKVTRQSTSDLKSASLPSWRILSESEKKLCKSMNLKPSQYISLKALILKEHGQKKKKGSPQKYSVENVDKAMKKKIVDFLARNNWIKA